MLIEYITYNILKNLSLNVIAVKVLNFHWLRFEIV